MVWFRYVLPLYMYLGPFGYGSLGIARSRKLAESPYIGEARL